MTGREANGCDHLLRSAYLWKSKQTMQLKMKVVSDTVPGMAGFGKFLADRDDLSRSDRRILKFIFRRDELLNKWREARSAADDAAPPAPNLPAYQTRALLRAPFTRI
jgi:hypothetical protein